MLKKIGAESIDELFEQIPESARCKKELNLPAPMSESEIIDHFSALSSTQAIDKVSFLGAGIYNHHIPQAVDHLLQRSEFYTAYTPYQPEISQGTLQAIFEFQTMVCRIFNMDVANASMYDGATALTEAALMARRATKKDRILVSKGVHPEYIQTLNTYLIALDNNTPDLEYINIDARTGQTDVEDLKNKLNDQTACVIVGYPNFYGVIEPLDKIVSLAEQAGARSITSTCNPYAFGVISPPGDFDIDIATAEGQAVATAPSFGGPGLGLFSIKKDKKLLRQMPGRLVGKTKDVNGNDGFVLTLATREQHIRREKATSNICTNNGLIALSAAINLGLLGKTGFQETAMSCVARSEYLRSRIAKLDAFQIVYSAPTFNEFAVKCLTDTAANVLNKLNNAGFLGGVNLNIFDPQTKDSFLVAVTETHSISKLDSFIKALSAC